PATVVVTLPADARLTIDGHPTRSTSGTRWFVTPPLRPGQEYTYTFRAELVRPGQTITVARQVPVWAGRQTDVCCPLGGTAAAAALPQGPLPSRYPAYPPPVSPEGPRVSQGYDFNKWQPDSSDPFSRPPHD